MPIIFLLFLATLSPLFSNDSKLEDGLEESQKPIFISISAVGTIGDSLSIPIFECAESCEENGAWTIPIHRKTIRDSKEKAEREAFSNVFNKISQNGQTLSLKIGQAGFLEVVPKYYDLLDTDIDSDVYQQVVSNYINKDGFINPAKKILIDSLPHRLNQKVKVTPEIKERVMNKTYLIATYIDSINGKFHLNNSFLDNGYDIQLLLDVSLKTIIYKYSIESDMFLPFSEFESNSFQRDTNISQDKYFESPYKARPSRQIGETLVEDEFYKAFKSAYKELLKKLENIDEFKTRKPIIDITGTQLIFSKDKHFRIDTPILLEVGNDEVIGWGKVRSDNRIDVLQLDKMISRHDFLSPLYWNGLSVGVGAEISQSKLEYEDTEFATLSTQTANLYLNGDLGYIFDSELLSEIWLSLSIGTGSGEMENSENANFDTFELTDTMNFSATLQYHLYFTSPFYLSFGGGLSGEYNEFEFKYSNTEESNTIENFANFSMNTYEANLLFGMGFDFTPNLGIYSEFKYAHPFMFINDLEDRDQSNGYPLQDRFDKDEFTNSSRINLSLGLLYKF
jgi:hypothetical protein